MSGISWGTGGINSSICTVGISNIPKVLVWLLDQMDKSMLIQDGGQTTQR
jgi:hypothetical protein